MIPWLITVATMVAALAVMYLMKGRKQERAALTGLFVLVLLASCAAIFLDGYQGGNSGLLKAVCFAMNLVILLRIDDAKKKKRKM